MSAGPSLLLDTCVWLDAFLGSRQGHDDACRLLDLLRQSGDTPLVAITSLKDVYYLVPMTLKRDAMNSPEGVSPQHAVTNEIAWGCIANMLECATPVALDYADIWLATKLRSLHEDFEDDVIVASLRRANADYLVTDDAELIRHFPDDAMSVADAIALLDASA